VSGVEIAPFVYVKPRA